MTRAARWAWRNLTRSPLAAVAVGFTAMQVAARPPRWPATLIAFAVGAVAAAHDARVRRFAPVAVCRAVIGRGEHGAVRIVHVELHRINDAYGCVEDPCPYAVAAVKIAASLGLVPDPTR